MSGSQTHVIACVRALALRAVVGAFARTSSFLPRVRGFARCCLVEPNWLISRVESCRWFRKEPRSKVAANKIETNIETLILLSVQVRSVFLVLDTNSAKSAHLDSVTEPLSSATGFLFLLRKTEGNNNGFIVLETVSIRR